MFKHSVLAMTLLAILAYPGVGRGSVEVSAVGKLGFFLPLGDWYAHRYVDGVDQFQGSYVLCPEVEIKFSDIGISVLYSYADLQTTEWEDFVNGQGENLYASGSISQLGGVLAYYFVNTQRNCAYIEGGLCYVSLVGKEQFRGFNYDYDFLQSGLGYLAGAGYQFAFNRRLSLLLTARFLWEPEGIRYPEGKTYDVYGIYFLPGLKLTF